MLTTSALGLAACSKKDAGTGDNGTGDQNPPPTYTITFNANGGTLATGAATSATTNSSGKITLPADPTRENYTFSGWYTLATDGTQVTANTVFTQNGTIFAHWTENGGGVTPPPPGDTTYTITLVGNGGVLAGGVSSVTTGTDGKLAQLPADPTPNDQGATFKGWFDAATGGTQITTDTVFTQNGSIYAQYTAAVVDTGTGLYVNGTCVAALENITENITAPEVATKEYMKQGVQLSPGDVVTIKIDNVALTHAAGTLELWSAEASHGVVFSQSAGTFTVNGDAARPFSIYVRFYPEAVRQQTNPNDHGDCWSVEFTDGLSDAADTRETCDGTSVYLVGKMFSDAAFQWGKGLKLVDNTVTVTLKVGDEVKIREGNTGHGYTQIKSGSEYFDDVDGQNHNLQCKEAGTYTFTWIPAEYKFDITKA